MEITEILQDAEAWVAIGLVLFFGLLFVLKVPGAAGKALDDRAAKIQAALDEAQALRDEATVMVNSLRQQRADTERLAAALLAEAQAEAQRLETEAKAKLEEQIVRRTALAEQRIKLAEQQAAQEVKSAAADLAAQAAEILLTARIQSLKADPLVDAAIPEIATRLQ
jgi:F-type H+-transporting ATPase subunit b